MNPDSTALSSDALLAQMEWVRELARRLVQDQADADDVAQEVWVAAVERPPAVSSDLRSWLAVVTRRVVQGMGRSASRRQRREAQAARAEAAPDHSDVLARGETCQRLVAAVMALDEPYRSTVLHRYLDGLSTKQIATLDRVTELVVRKRLSRAMHQLRARLDEEFEGGRGAWMAAFSGLRHPASSALAVGVGLGGLLLMKKALVLVVVAIVLSLVWFKSPVQQWLGRHQDNRTPTQPTVAESPSSRSTLDVPNAPENVRQSVPEVPAASSPTLTVDGVVVDLPAPGTSAEAVPAADIEVSLQEFPRMQIRAVTRTGADGRFHIEVPSTGFKLAQIGAAGDETYRGAGKKLRLDDIAGLHDCRLERAPHGDIYGIVVSEDDRPLARVSVILDEDRPDGRPERPTDSPQRMAQYDAQYAKDQERTAVTDSAGAFRFSTVQGSKNFMGGHELIAVKEGMRMVPISPVEGLIKGGWKPITLRMVPAGGQIAVTVRDDNGQPMPKVQISVSVSNSEPGANRASKGLQEDPAQKFTDDEGHAVLDNVWIGKKLVLEIRSGVNSWRCERAARGRIDLRKAPEGDAIAVPTSKNLELKIVLPSDITLRVTAVTPTGEAIPNAKLTIDGMDSDFFDRPRTDTNGQIAKVIARPVASLTLSVAATVEQKDSNGASSALAGNQLVEVTPDSPEEVPVRLVLGPALTITGTVREKDGRPCAGSVLALPHGARAEESLLVHGAEIDRSGRFEARDLVPGLYDLEVRPARNCDNNTCLLSQQFPGFAAGSRDVQLVLGDDEAVNVEIEVAALDGQIAQMAVHTCIFSPYKERETAGHTPDANQRFSGLSGWPEEAIHFTDAPTKPSSPEGTTAFCWANGTVPLHRLRPMNPGWYRIGLDASDSTGQHYHRCGTGLVYLTSGSYRFHFDLVRQSTLEGSITGSNRPADVCVALFAPDGTPVQVSQTVRHFGEVMPVGEDGQFRLDGVPVGELLLRVGPEAVLRSGKSIYEQHVTVGAGENARLTIALP